MKGNGHVCAVKLCFSQHSYMQNPFRYLLETGDTVFPVVGRLVFRGILISGKNVVTVRWIPL